MLKIRQVFSRMTCKSWRFSAVPLWMLILMGMLVLTPVEAGSFQEKASLERHIEERAQSILNTVYGKHSFSVSVRITLSSESWRVKYTEQANVKLLKKEGKGEDYKILPGFTAIKNLSPDEMSRLPFNSEIIRYGGSIKQIDVALLASKAVSKKSAQQAEKILTEMVPLNPDRGDTIVTSFETFPVTAKKKKEEGKGLNLTTLLLMIAVALLALYMLIYIRIEKKKLQAQATAGSQGASKTEAEEGGKGASSAEGTSQVTTEIEQIKQFFGFITVDKVEDLIDIIKKEKISLQYVSLIVAYLEPRISAILLQSFSTEEQAKIVNQIIKQQVIEKSTLEKIEALIKGKMESLVGGDRVLGSILNCVNNDGKKALLTVVKKDLEAYKKIRPNVILIDDISHLTDSEVKLVISELSMDILSSLLNSVDKSTKDILFKNISDSAKAMLTQYLELKGVYASKTELEKSQKYVLDVLMRLEYEGKIELKKHLK